MADAHWTVKYAPHTVDAMCGNQTVIKRALKWIGSFERGNGATVTSSVKVPLLIIFGPYGSGKTSLAYCLLKHGGYHPLELNAGAIRSKKRIRDMMDKILSNEPLTTVASTTVTRPVGIIMDEIDGMSCGDKGGLHQLFQMVQERYEAGESVRNPIICISSTPFTVKLADRLHLSINMRRPAKNEAVAYLQTIAAKESAAFEPNPILGVPSLLAICNHCQCDMRKCVAMLQCMSDCGDDAPPFCPTELDYSIFDITRMMFNVKSVTQRRLHHLYRTDKNLLPLMIHENLVANLNHKHSTAEESGRCYLAATHNLVISDAIEDDNGWDTSLCKALLSCGSVNEMIGSKKARKRAQPTVQFTNVLTKSATKSNLRNFLVLHGNRHCVSLRHVFHHFAAVVQSILRLHDSAAAAAESVAAPKPSSGSGDGYRPRISYADFEKYLQLYQRVRTYLRTPLKVSNRQKRAIKKALQSPSSASAAAFEAEAGSGGSAHAL